MEPIRKESLSDIIEHQLETMILKGELKPGQRVNELELANKLQVSRSPVREACLKLMGKGLIQAFPNRGSFIASLEVAEAVEIYQIRIELEGLAARLAARLQPSTDSLNNILEEMRKQVTAQDVQAYFRLNREFHLLIASLSGNETLKSLHVNLFNRLSLFQLKTLAQPQGLQTSMREHTILAQAIGAGQEETAAQAARSHVQSSLNRLQTVLGISAKK
ncbi:MAG: FCD domain-containing protein [Lentisphaerae bacterium]|nr:MAG: FCD domain-containing protein [Lentisphaerota bacterium]